MLSGFKAKISHLLRSKKELSMRELFSSHIKNIHAYELHDLISNLDHEVIYLNFDRIVVLEINFFSTLKKLSGENYSRIRYVKMPETFKRHI